MRQLAQSLRGAVGRSVQVVASLRSEFLDDLRDLPDLARVPIEAYVLAPLDREMLRDVIEQPARVLATTDRDGTVTLWDVTDRNEGRPLGEPLSDHAGEVYAMAFAPDGRTMAVGARAEPLSCGT